MPNYTISACYHPDYPIIIESVYLHYKQYKIQYSLQNVLSPNGWGTPYPFFRNNDNEDFILPQRIEAYWHSELDESTYFRVDESIPYEIVLQWLQKKQCETQEPIVHNIIIGFSHSNSISIWCNGTNKSMLIKSTIKPKETLYNIMQQFTYRYLPLFEHWYEDAGKWTKYTEEEQETKPVFDYIEEALYDGTHDKLHDGGLLHYHEAGKPKKLAVQWHIKKSDYTVYFWFEDKAIRAIFDKFYGIHPETKTDFIIHIDPIKNKYQLALYRYGLQEPKTIPEDAYQLIVFKNKFEQYRSPNYDQPRGAWIW